jgi:uncharacterized membrane protein
MPGPDNPGERSNNGVGNGEQVNSGAKNGESGEHHNRAGAAGAKIWTSATLLLQRSAQFLAQGIHLTEQRTGVLIFASVAERYAEIVADSGINAKVQPDVWSKALAAKGGASGDGFVAAVELCGEQLAQYFPPGALNPDELPNKVVEI